MIKNPVIALLLLACFGTGTLLAQDIAAEEAADIKATMIYAVENELDFDFVLGIVSFFGTIGDRLDYSLMSFKFLEYGVLISSVNDANVYIPYSKIAAVWIESDDADVDQIFDKMYEKLRTR